MDNSVIMTLKVCRTSERNLLSTVGRSKGGVYSFEIHFGISHAVNTRHSPVRVNDRACRQLSTCFEATPVQFLSSALQLQVEYNI